MEALSPVNAILSTMGSGVAQKAPDIMSDLDEFMPGFDLITDNRNYYEYHHTAADTFDKISLKGLQEQSAVVAILGYALADLGREPANVKQK